MKKIEYMICPNKKDKKCHVTGNDCSHAVKHKLNSFCNVSTCEICPKCISYAKRQYSASV